MPRKRGQKGQRGGTLEPRPFQPDFKYTKSRGRQEWVKTFYPYAQYFFNLFREIPWAEYQYEDADYKAKCSKIPYWILGGTACEVYHENFKNHPNYNIDLHSLVDPTGDIDCSVNSLIVEKKDAMNLSTMLQQYVTGAPEPTLIPMYDNFTTWLFGHIVDYFEKLSYNFEEWFPNATEYDNEKNHEGKHADLMKEVGPFTILRTILPLNDNNISEGAAVKLQVTMAIKYIEDDGSEKIYQEHFIEFLFWEDPEFTEKYRNVFETNPKLGLILRGIRKECYGNYDGAINRYAYKNSIQYSHKFYNHIQRYIYLLKLILFGLNNGIEFASDKDMKTIIREYYDVINDFLANNNDYFLAKYLLMQFPEEIKTKYIQKGTTLEYFATTYIIRLLENVRLRTSSPEVSGNNLILHITKRPRTRKAKNRRNRKQRTRRA